MSQEPAATALSFEVPPSGTNIGDLMLRLNHAVVTRGKPPSHDGPLNASMEHYRKDFRTRSGIFGKDLIDPDLPEHRSGLMEMAHSFLVQEGSTFWPTDPTDPYHHHNLTFEHHKNIIQLLVAQIFYKKNLNKFHYVRFKGKNVVQPFVPSNANVEDETLLEAIGVSNTSSQPERLDATQTRVSGNGASSSLQTERPSFASPRRDFHQREAVSLSMASEGRTSENVSAGQDRVPEAVMHDEALRVDGLTDFRLGSGYLPETGHATEQPGHFDINGHVNPNWTYYTHQTFMALGSPPQDDGIPYGLDFSRSPSQSPELIDEAPQDRSTAHTWWYCITESREPRNSTIWYPSRPIREMTLNEFKMELSQQFAVGDSPMKFVLSGDDGMMIQSPPDRIDEKKFSDTLSQLAEGVRRHLKGRGSDAGPMVFTLDIELVRDQPTCDRWMERSMSLAF